jgi:hypothetical protein
MATSVRAQRDVGGQRVEIAVDRGFRPVTVEAHAGRPLRLVFRRTDPDSCSERVIFSSPRISRRLALWDETVVDLPAQSEGEVRYTCGMGRYRGRIVFVDDGGPQARSRRWLADHQGGLVLGAILGLCGLPFVVILASLIFGTALWPALGIAIVTWLIGCLVMGSMLERNHPS